jgi:glutaredoxin
VQYIDVSRDPQALDTMLVASKGRRVVPVIVEGSKVTIGFGGT